MSIQTSIGTPTATSYISVASATEYFNMRSGSDEWLDMGSTGTISKTTYRENLLKQATREIDKTYRFFNGKYNTGAKNGPDYQNLEFPRSNNYDYNGDIYIPDEIKDATCEQALWITQRGATRYTQEGNTVKSQFISDECFNYLKGYITTQVQPVGQYRWNG